MKLIAVALASFFTLGISLANAQTTAPGGGGSTTGDPAASSATSGGSQTTGTGMTPSRSGSGTSTSGGRDDNGDQGRDRMPESNKTVRPNDPDPKQK